MTTRCAQLAFCSALVAGPSCAQDYAYKPPPTVVPECVVEQPFSAPVGLRVEGNRIVDATGQEFRLRGINRSGSEYMCVQGQGIFDGPVDDDAILAMVKWGINSVRIPLNEDCWLGINGVADAYAGAAYQEAIASYIDRLHGHGLYAIVDLHWSAPGANLAIHQQPLPDADHSPAFWSSVAQRFKGDQMVVFDLHNEPFVSNTTTSSDPWACWRDGCTITSEPDASEGIAGPWQAAGMQALVDAVRATGAEQVLILGGLSYANDLSGWRRHRPHDSLCNLAGSYHEYMKQCSTEACWTSHLQDISALWPVVTGEIGQYDCQHDSIDRYTTWADARRISYLAWAWNTQDCGGFPALIRRYDGTPTNFGIGYRDHLLTTSP